MSLHHIFTGFENASPLDWEIADSGQVRIGMLYDHERSSPNRAAGHWFFQLQGRPGSEITLHLENFDNIWNGRKSSPLSARTNCFLSADGVRWTAAPMVLTPDNGLAMTVLLEGESLYLARLEPYRLSDLERLLSEIADHQLVEIETIGATVEGRPLEMVRVGREDAPSSVLVRARSHPWEPGGNWVAQGLIHSLLRDEPDNARFLNRYCVYVMPMAAKDGVVRGHTRFNLQGIDLNRGWDRLADPRLAPENTALETWLDTRKRQGRVPRLAIDFHNDNSGKLHLSHPAGADAAFPARMVRLEALLRRHTWFTEGSTSPDFRNPGTFGEGLQERYGIDACILELNCDWIAGLGKVPFGADWERFGDGLRRVFYDYLDDAR